MAKIEYTVQCSCGVERHLDSLITSKSEAMSHFRQHLKEVIKHDIYIDRVVDGVTDCSWAMNRECVFKRML